MYGYLYKFRRMLRMNKLMKRCCRPVGLLVLDQAGLALAAQDDSKLWSAFSTKVRTSLPGSLDGQSGDGQGSGALRRERGSVAARPSENQADGGAATRQAAAGTAGTDSVTSRCHGPERSGYGQQTILLRPMPGSSRSPDLQQKKQPDRHQPIHLFFRFRCSVRIPHGLTL